VLTDFEKGWLAGILDGEGSFWVMKKKPSYRYPKISVVMSDYDTVAKVAKLFGDRTVTPQASRSENRKPMFRANLMGQGALDLMEELHPVMSIRRQAKIEELLVEFRPSSSILSGPRLSSG
jgi:hypothetical protein